MDLRFVLLSPRLADLWGKSFLFCKTCCPSYWLTVHRQNKPGLESLLKWWIWSLTVLWENTYVKIFQIVHFKCELFIGCQLPFNKPFIKTYFMAPIVITSWHPSLTPLPLSCRHLNKPQFSLYPIISLLYTCPHTVNEMKDNSQPCTLVWLWMDNH